MSVCFKVKKIIGISIGEGNSRNYRVQWEPSWVTGFQLVGCENLIEEYMKAEQDHSEGSSVYVDQTEEEGHRDNNAFSEPEGKKEYPDANAKQSRECYSTHRASMVVQNNFLYGSEDDTVLHWDNKYTDDNNVQIICMEQGQGNQDQGGTNPSDKNINPNFEWNNSFDSVLTCGSESMGYDGKNEVEAPFQSTGTEIQREDTIVIKSAGRDAEAQMTIVKELPEDLSEEEKVKWLAKHHPWSNLISKKISKKIDDRTQGEDEQPNLTLLSDEFKCRICGKNFTNSSGLTRHCNRIHGVGQRFACHICNENFKCQTSLQRHARSHSANQDFSCTICREQLKDRQEFNAHMKTHTPTRRYPCSDCGKLFVASTDLKRHQRVHTNERPFACDVCPKRFKINDHLQKHLKTHRDAMM